MDTRVCLVCFRVGWLISVRTQVKALPGCSWGSAAGARPRSRSVSGAPPAHRLPGQTAVLVLGPPAPQQRGLARPRAGSGSRAGSPWPARCTPSPPATARPSRPVGSAKRLRFVCWGHDAEVTGAFPLLSCASVQACCECACACTGAGGVLRAEASGASHSISSNGFQRPRPSLALVYD